MSRRPRVPDAQIADAVAQVVRARGRVALGEIAAAARTPVQNLYRRLNRERFVVRLFGLLSNDPGAVSALLEYRRRQLRRRQADPRTDLAGPGDFYTDAPLPPASTDAMPGTDEKIQVLTERESLKCRLHHPDDARAYTPPDQRWDDDGSVFINPAHLGGRRGTEGEGKHRFRLLCDIDTDALSVGPGNCD